MLYTFIENPSSHFDAMEYTPVVHQKSIYKANDPNETDFLSKNPDLIWGILIGVMVLAFAFYAFLKKKKD